MVLFEWVIALLLGAVVLTALARRLGVPYPALLAVGGALLALVPDGPQLVLDPELALALFIAPILLDAGYDTSVRDLRENWVPVGALVLGAVLVTTAVVAVVARALVPGLPWAAAVALGAIVAPPDAAAATSVLRQVRLPHRLLVILEGESLLNDGSALLIYRLAVAAAMTQAFSAAQVVPMLLVVVGGSVVAGIVLARLYLRLTQRVIDVPMSIVLQFVGTFGVWILAERLGLSAVLTIVVYAITIARTAPADVPARLRVPAYAVWELVVFVLNVLAFMIVGLQLRPILERLSAAERTDYFVVAAAVVVTVIVVRVAWVMAYNTAARWKIRRFGTRQRRPSMQPTVSGGLLVSWAGMRGIVTLAAALALPDGRGGHGASGAEFPHRDLLVFTAFCVVLGTLVVQGLTLRPLVDRLGLVDDGSVEREAAAARAAAMRAALASLDGETAPECVPEVRAIRREYSLALDRAPGEDGRVLRGFAGDGIRRRALAAARSAVLALRSRGDVGDAAFHQVEEELDWLELGAGGGEHPAAPSAAPSVAATVAPAVGDPAVGAAGDGGRA